MLKSRAAFAAALLKVVEAQQRGFAHGHGKVHSVPDGSKELHDSLDNVVREVAKLKEASGDRYPADEDILAVFNKERQSYNARLISSASTRQYESATLPARQMGQDVRDAPFSEKQQRQSRYDGGLEDDGFTERALVPEMTYFDLLTTYRPNNGDWYTGFYIKNIENSRHLIGIDRGSEVEGSVLNATIGMPRTYGINFGINF